MYSVKEKIGGREGERKLRRGDTFVRRYKCYGIVSYGFGLKVLFIYLSNSIYGVKQNL